MSGVRGGGTLKPADRWAPRGWGAWASSGFSLWGDAMGGSRRGMLRGKAALVATAPRA